MKIKLSTKGKYAIIDKSDYDLVKGFAWYCTASGEAKFAYEKKAKEIYGEYANV